MPLSPSNSPSNSSKTLRIGHSPDPDDAFMWYPIAQFPNGSGPGGKTYTPRIDTQGYEFQHIIEDIESLNKRADRAELEITALSIHQYAHVADEYILTSCGASMGEGYGPMVIARRTMTLGDLTDAKIAIPGERTTAFLAINLLMNEVCGKRLTNYEVVMFDQIIPRVAAGEFDAGLIIHEGQLTYGKAGLELVVDLGKWWTDTRNLPLPLGGNAIRRDLLPQAQTISRVLYDSIKYALDHRSDAIEYALNYARDMGTDLADEFIAMYVNEITLDCGERGRKAVRRMFDEAVAAGIIPIIGEAEFVEPN